MYIVFILINDLGALQVNSLIIDILKTKKGQMYKTVIILKPFWVAFGHLFPMKRGRGHLLESGHLLD